MELVQAEQATREPGRNISRGRLVWRRFRRKRLALFGLVVVVLEALLAYLGPLFSKWDVARDRPAQLRQLAGHRGGTGGAPTPQGHDMFVQTMSGTQKSLLVGLIAAVLSTAIAAIIGSAAGYFGKLTDNSLMWFTNLVMVVPDFLILAILSPRLRNTSFVVFALLLSAFSWMLTARVVRGLTFSLREREFIAAARFMGVPGLADHRAAHPAQHGARC